MSKRTLFSVFALVAFIIAGFGAGYAEAAQLYVTKNKKTVTPQEYQSLPQTMPNAVPAPTLNPAPNRASGKNYQPDQIVRHCSKEEAALVKKIDNGAMMTGSANSASPEAMQWKNYLDDPANAPRISDLYTRCMQIVIQERQASIARLIENKASPAHRNAR